MDALTATPRTSNAHRSLDRSLLGLRARARCGLLEAFLGAHWRYNVGVPRSLLTATAKASRTARWATTMTRWSIRHRTGGKRVGAARKKAVKRWQFVAFAGPNGAESRGIVDLIAIRRDHGTSKSPLKAGDLFEIVLIQIKGGAARDPNPADIKRLRAVKAHYKARAVVLASWLKGREPTFRVLTNGLGANAWRPVDPLEIFGARSLRTP